MFLIHELAFFQEMDNFKVRSQELGPSHLQISIEALLETRNYGGQVRVFGGYYLSMKKNLQDQGAARDKYDKNKTYE